MICNTCKAQGFCVTGSANYYGSKIFSISFVTRLHSPPRWISSRFSPAEPRPSAPSFRRRQRNCATPVKGLFWQSRAQKRWQKPPTLAQPLFNSTNSWRRSGGHKAKVHFALSTKEKSPFNASASFQHSSTPLTYTPHSQPLSHFILHSHLLSSLLLHSDLGKTTEEQLSVMLATSPCPQKTRLLFLHWTFFGKRKWLFPHRGLHWQTYYFHWVIASGQTKRKEEKKNSHEDK